MASTLYSDIVGEPTYWTNPNPDHATLLTTVGAGAATNSTDTARHLVNIATRSPTMLAFVLEGDEDHIHVGYNPTFYPAEIGHATPYDNLTVVFVGNNLATATPVVLPNDAHGRINNTRCKTVTHITGAQGHGAAPAAVRAGPWAAAEADTNEIRARRAFLLPADRVGDALTVQASGRYTFQAFHHTFLQDGLASADGDVQAAHAPLSDWYRCASTNNNTDHSVLAIAPVSSALPHNNLALTTYVEGVRRAELAKLGQGGPGLSTAAFQAGITDLQNTMSANSTAHINFQRERDNRSFTQKHGEALAQRMYNWTGVVDDDQLPETHRLLAKSNKNRDYGILSSLIQTRVINSSVPLTAANAPLPTTKLVDDVFRSLLPAGTGLTFAQGLTPFAIVCEGHAEQEVVRRKIKKAELAETGTSMTLADAGTLVTADVRLAATPQNGAEKLYGWSILVDLFFGVTRPISENVRNSVIKVGPALHRICEQYAENMTAGMDLVNRILFEYQQDFFAYVICLSTNPAATTPDFRDIESKVLTFRPGSLSTLPNTWYALFDIRPASRGGPPLNRETNRDSLRGQMGAVPQVNPNADRALISRFSGSGFQTISAMMQGHEVEVPKHGNKACCLVWAFKGQCSTNCKRKDQHVRYSRDTNTKLHKLLTDCGVANPQE